MITDDDGRIAKVLAAEINSAIAQDKEVSVFLASGKVIEGIVSAHASDIIMTLEHAAMSWRIRTDHVVGYSAK